MLPIFFEGCFISPEYICLNKLLVSTFCATSSHSHLATKPTELTFHIPPMSSSPPLVACTEYLPVQKPIKTYSTLCTMTSKIFSNTDLSIPFVCVNENVCGEELGSISLQNTSSKHKASNFVPSKLGLDRVAELTLRNYKPYSRIRKRESEMPVIF
jgi:hypothetical protein